MPPLEVAKPKRGRTEGGGREGERREGERGRERGGGREGEGFQRSYHKTEQHTHSL